MVSNVLRIIIAEDEVLVAESIEGMLEDIGHQVVGHASTGLQAVELTGELDPDVILMDIKMPTINGLEAARRITETSPTPIVVLTAFESRELLEQASLVGVGAYLVKPPRQFELERALTIATARFADIQKLRRSNDEMARTLEQMRQLKGILPICSGCKKIRDENDVWHEIEVYIRDHTGVDFSHGICPDCITELYHNYEQSL